MVVALVGALDEWRLLWKVNPVDGALAVQLELGLELWLVSVWVSTPGQLVDAMEVRLVAQWRCDWICCLSWFMWLLCWMRVDSMVNIV